MDNMEKENFEYMYKQTVAVKRNDRYELTSSLEDVWTGLTVYVGDSCNMLMIPNSEKSFLTDTVEDLLCNNLGINETVQKIKEKINRKFEYSYSKSPTIEKEVYVLVYNDENVELFWNYSDAYNRMVEDAEKTAKEWARGHKLTIEDYSAKVDVFGWKIVAKKIK